MKHALQLAGVMSTFITAELGLPRCSIGHAHSNQPALYIQVVDPRRAVRDATAEALLRGLPAVQDAGGAVPRAFRPLRLIFDRARPFQAVSLQPSLPALYMIKQCRTRAELLRHCDYM